MWHVVWEIQDVIKQKYDSLTMSLETPNVSDTSNRNSAEAEHFQDLPCLFSCIPAVVVTDAESLQEFYQATTEIFTMRKNHPSSSPNGTEISCPLPLQLVPSSLVIYIWSPWARCLGSAVYPHQNSISQDGTVFTWTEEAVLQRKYALLLALIRTQFSEKELEFSVFSYTLC